MTFSILHRMGDGEQSPPLDALDALYDELLEDDDPEHGEVGVCHDETEMSLTAYRSGVLIWSDAEDDRPRHMKDVSRDKVLELWKALAAGDLDRVSREPWKSGYY